MRLSKSGGKLLVASIMWSIIAPLCTGLGVSIAQDLWEAPPEAIDIKNPLPLNESTIQAGRKLFQRSCMPCHGQSGRGDGPAAFALNPKPKDLSDTERMRNMTDGELFWKVSEGRGNMPSFADAHTDEERWQIINYLRALAR